MKEYKEGKAFPDGLMKKIKDKFYYVDEDPFYGKRLFFDNSGGAFRLKSAVDATSKWESFPDCPERTHEMSLKLQEVMANGERDIRIIFGVDESYDIITTLTATQVMWRIVQTIAESIEGDNIVTSCLEHPSAFDAAAYYAEKTGKELRVAMANKSTGKVEPEEVASKIDENTCLLSIMAASNLTGAAFDIEGIVKAARAIKPDLYIVVDCVQHAPHSIIELQKYDIDGANIGPYKFFGCRGSGIGVVSDRVSQLRHTKLIHKDNKIWNLGTPTPAQFANITAIVDHVCWIATELGEDKNLDRAELFRKGLKSINLHERALLNRFLEGLRGIENIKLHFDDPDLTTRDLIVAVQYDNIDCASAANELQSRGVIVAPRLESSEYSRRMLESFGIKDGVLRVSPLHCNSFADVDEFIEIAKDIAKL